MTFGVRGEPDPGVQALHDGGVATGSGEDEGDRGQQPSGVEAPLAYSLSAFAALVYLVLAVALVRGERRLALAACGIELAGVLVIGTLSLADPEAFPHATVWSGYGSGYVFIPLVLPLVGLYWLLRRK
ncbi:hypothetical protein ACFQ08_27690 [Streptosporangium algeriense]|uniref:Integral membrane protein n=1 Tax=Streptosporangium algeriense TaxID=1682748 RepID=A0ABW3DZX5_9ACTN